MAQNVVSGNRDDEEDDWPIPPQSQLVETLFPKAKKRYEERKYDEAMRFYGIILHEAKTKTDESPNSVYGFIKSLYMIARCHMEKGNYEQATSTVDMVCELVLSVCPENIHIPEKLIIEIEKRHGDILKAFVLALIFKEMHPSNKNCKVVLSDIQEKLEESFTKSGYIKTVFSVLMLKGKSFYKNNEPSIATAFFDKTIELFHFLPTENLKKTYIWRAKCLLMMGNLKEAESDIIKVLTRYPTHSKARTLHQKIKEAQKAKNKKENADDLATSKGNNHVEKCKLNNATSETKPAKPLGLVNNDVLPSQQHKEEQKSPKTQTAKQKVEQCEKKKSADNKAVEGNENNEHTLPNAKKSRKHHPVQESKWEGLPKAPNTQGLLKDIEKSSNSPCSQYSSNRDSCIGQEKSTDTPCGASTSCIERQANNLKKDNKDITEKVTNEDNLIDETQWETVKKKSHAKKAIERKPFALPDGVEVICEHFEKETFSHPQMSSKIPKICQTCQTVTSGLKYAYWIKELKEWENVRIVPSSMSKSTTIRSCHRFQKEKRCLKNDCTYAHGPELQMWDLQLRGELPSPETYLSNKKKFPAANNATNLPNDGASSTSINNIKPTCGWSKRDMTSQRQQINPIQPPVHLSSSNSASSNTCYLPPGVHLVCDHFINDYKCLRIGIDQKKNVCKLCGPKRVVKYAFWARLFHRWYLIRTYPKRLIRVAFQPCKDFNMGRRCLREPCTFAHGPELTMWTMEREGSLTPPERALYLDIIEGTNNPLGTALRPLPLGALVTDLRLCKSVESRIVCRFGRCCRYAHSEAEIALWKKSYEEKLAESKRTRAQETVSEQSLRHHVELKLTESIKGVDLSSKPGNPNVQLAEDCNDHSYTWEFCARVQVNKERLQSIELQRHRQYFHFTRVEVVGFDMRNKPTNISSNNLGKAFYHKLQPLRVFDCKVQVIEFRITVKFQASVFGSFTQRILFDFGKEPLLMKEFNIDIGSKDTLEKLTDARQAVKLGALPWDDRDMEIIRCETNPERENFTSAYSLPKEVERIVSAQLVGGEIRKDTYKQTMHQLLFAEEVHMKNLLQRLTLENGKLQGMKTIFHELEGLKIAQGHDLFGVIELDSEIAPDDMAGRVCIRNVLSVMIRSPHKTNCMYEIPIINQESKKVFVHLTPRICKDLKIRDKSVVDVGMRFNLNRNILCMMHKALESLRLTHIQQLFPVEQNIARRQVNISWKWFLDQRLNECQKRVIQAIGEAVPPSPPLVVFGPFGTGKTFTLNQAVIYLMRERANRVLLCTHTNSAADIHVELLDEYLKKSGMIIHAVKPLRIYDPERKLSTASEICRKYALIDNQTFLEPTRKKVIEHRVIITTLTTADLLTKLNVHHGFFTHILIDEAAQAWETEALIPIALAGPNTKIVFTGDHMQMSPEVYSEFARKWGLQTSLPERLFDHYNKSDDASFKNEQVLFLFENYRTNEEILKFPSENCYRGKIVAKGYNPCHPDSELPPLIFYSSKGKDEKQEDNSYLNSSEVYEIVKRVTELIKKWPSCWGQMKLEDVIILSPYKYQVKAIREQLRMKRLGKVTVDTIHNVQGKEYRALFISTVRTWNSFTTHESFLEFLSDPKLLITAVTRAKSLVAVVGDPFALCTLGGCTLYWKDYIRRCSTLNGLYGTTWEELNVEILNHFSGIPLNPEAVSFVPKSQAEGNIEDEATKAASDNLESSANSVLSNSLVVEPDDKVSEDQISSCSSDIQDNFEGVGHCDFIEDEAVLQIDIDKIIEELCKFIKNRQEASTRQAAALSEEEFPPLTKNPSNEREPRPSWPSKMHQNRSIDLRSLRSEYQIRTSNGRTEIQLLDIYISPSEKVHQIVKNPYKQQNLEPEVLMNMVNSEPSRYLTGQLQIANDKSRRAHTAIRDKEKPDIPVRGSIKHTFDRDTVVIDVQPGDQTENKPFGILVGVLNHIMNPRERQYVCEVDVNNPSIMIPINKSVTKIVNLSDKMLEDIPIYKKRKTFDEKLSKIKMVRLEDVINNKYLFVVEFLQWRGDCTYPLGIAVKTIPKGETTEHCRRILFAEFGIRTYSKAIIGQCLPTSLEIPNSELKTREKIAKAFTIDPPESKDLDDAISVEEIREGIFKVGIHIADVSFFVQRASNLDREARQRGVSYYPGSENENIPMLPRELSENICSLLPNKDRLTVSVFVTLNNKGEIVSKDEILKTVTRSCCKLSYSQAQYIIEGEDQLEEEIPKRVCKDIKVLHSLAVKMRRLRLKEASFDHSNDTEDTEAHELIEEFMILANHRVGKFLHDKKPRIAPFRTQLEPKIHLLNDWAANYGAFAKYSPSMQSHLKSEDITDEVKDRISMEENDIEIYAQEWDQIRKAAFSGNHRRVESLISNPSCSPQLAIALQHHKRIQTKSQYECSGSNTRHHSLRLSNYVHFTSPIRRYIDIEVHRLLLTQVASSGSKEQSLLDEEEMSTLCRRSTHFKDNSTKFEREYKRIQFASALKQKSQAGVFLIDQLEKRFFTIHPVSPDQDHFLIKHKTIKFDDLSPTSISEKDDEKPETTLKWRFRMYIGQSLSSNDAHEQSDSVSSEESFRSRLMDAKKIKNTIIVDKKQIEVHKIKGKTWMEIMDAIQNERLDEVLRRIEDTNRELQDNGEGKKTVKGTTDRYVYKHPNFGQQAIKNTSENDGHFHEITMRLKQYDMLDFQMFSRLYRGMLCPDVQLLRLSPNFCVCLEHRKSPHRCFAYETKRFASEHVYQSIDEYIWFWKPVLAMEAASGAVSQNDGFILKSLTILWRENKEKSKVEGKFTLMQSYCKSRQIKFNYGDLACVKIPYEERHDENQCSSQSDTKAVNKQTVIWIGHCVVENVKEKKEKEQVRVQLRIHQIASNLPPHLLNAHQQCDLEIIHQPLPLRRMSIALNRKLDSSSDLVQTICLGKSSIKETFPIPGESLSLAAQYKASGFQPLNKYQEAAVQQALKRPFSLIQGPPGTGKTVTGVHIAYWFAKQNNKLKPAMNYQRKSEKKKKNKCSDEKEPLAPPQVLYCGPSNKSVDVVTEYLLRIPQMEDKVLRVHGSLIQESEFPIPNKIKLSRAKVSEDELKIPEKKVKEVSLHHFIRNEKSPYAKDLKEMEEQFAISKNSSEEDVAKYCELIAAAEKWAIQEAGKEIILCTCSRAGSSTITKGCNNVQQCIIDESGMCMEPEILVPMTSSNAKQFVLIGDHKQLQPIVVDKHAKSLGLEISMFERLADQALMLQIQYRMHQSICEFPSVQFYRGMLETPESVKSRKTAKVEFWPAKIRDDKDITVAFCHVEGVEDSSVISTAESGVDSKYNIKEARKAVQVAKYLVNKHPSIKKKNVVILTPYRQQRKEIQDLLRGAYDEILVTTIIKSQGSEWDYVILSLVRSLPEADLEPEPSSLWLGEHLGFIADDHQINVALTRAKNGLCIIGNKNLLVYNPTWRSLLEHYQERNCVVNESWPWEHGDYQQ